MEKAELSTTTKNREGPGDERDSFTFCLLAVDKESADEYKVVNFNPCTQYEETIVHRLDYRLGCALVALGGMLAASLN